MAGKAKKVKSRFGYEGTYILGDGLVNGYPHWLKTDGSKAIWFGIFYTAWLVGDKEFLGYGHAEIWGPAGNVSYPNEIKQRWHPNDVIFKAIG